MPAAGPTAAVGDGALLYADGARPGRSRRAALPVAAGRWPSWPPTGSAPGAPGEPLTPLYLRRPDAVEPGARKAVLP